MTVLDEAIQIATKYHAGQIDNEGLPYIFHPLTMMMNVDEGRGRVANIKRIVTVLYDMCKDEDIKVPDVMWELKETCPDLMKEDFTRVYNALSVLKYEKGVPYMEYIRTLRDNEIARCVKIAVIEHNKSPERMNELNFEEREKWGKQYDKALAFLTGVTRPEMI